MSAQDHLHVGTTCSVELTSNSVDAGSDLELFAGVFGTPTVDLEGHTVHLKDQAGSIVASVELGPYNELTEGNRTRTFTAKAPLVAGDFTWLVEFPAHEDETVSVERASVKFTFNVRAHATSVVVWDVPTAVAGGDTFRIKVGVKCARECNMEHRTLILLDDKGIELAKAEAGGEIWPKSAALYFTEVEIKAPEAVGMFKWSAKAPFAEITNPGSETSLAHSEGTASFDVRLVAQPDYKVTVEAYDRVKQKPLSGAVVVMHPYRSVTDENGVAEVRVAKGQYKLFVSRTKYLNYGMSVDVVDGDVNARAELEVEPPPDRE